jgi:hypothetical protein
VPLKKQEVSLKLSEVPLEKVFDTIYLIDEEGDPPLDLFLRLFCAYIL